MGDPPDAPGLDPDYGYWDERERRREADEERAEQRFEMEREAEAVRTVAAHTLALVETALKVQCDGGAVNGPVRARLRDVARLLRKELGWEEKENKP